jgi:ribosomal protein S9
MIKARFHHSDRYPHVCSIEVEGLVTKTTVGIPIGQAYALRDALSACLEEYEEYFESAFKSDGSGGVLAKETGEYARSSGEWEKN